MIYNINIFTDGACSGNPGPGGPGYVITERNVIIAESKPYGFRKTTNNRMEIKAVSLALGYFLDILKDSPEITDTAVKKVGESLRRRDTDIKVTVFSDSQLVVKTLTDGWSRKTNNDLWNDLDDAIADLVDFRSGHVTLEFKWVKGHDKSKWNNLADRLAVEASQNPVNIDEVYEGITPMEKTQTLFTQIEPVEEPTVKEVRLVGFSTQNKRQLVIILSNNDVVNVIPCHGGFQQYGCTKAESQITVDIAWKYVKWLNGGEL